jgi:hypothetical protein
MKRKCVYMKKVPGGGYEHLVHGGMISGSGVVPVDKLNDVLRGSAELVKTPAGPELQTVVEMARNEMNQMKKDDNPEDIFEEINRRLGSMKFNPQKRGGSIVAIK